MQCAFAQSDMLCTVPCIGRTFLYVEPAVGDVIAINCDYHVKLQFQYLLRKFIFKVPHLIMTTYNKLI